MPRFRGHFNPARQPLPECPTEDAPRLLGWNDRCNCVDPITSAGWYCTRKPGHAGDHVTKDLQGRIVVRWGKGGEARP